MKKIVTILGARPQFIKSSAVSRQILKHNKKFDSLKEIIIHTGQHFDERMSNIFFDEMSIQKPKYFLDINDKSHGAMTGQMIEKIEQALLKENPDWVLVYGDTNSTLAGAIAASKLNIKIAHVEAGLRSFNMQMPEEINRILTDRLSSILFCPTDTAIKNLQNEGISNWKNEVRTSLCGDVMLDCSLFYKKLAKKPINIQVDNEYVLCTIHRAENTDNKTRLQNIFSGLNEISKKIQIILPIHPRTKNLIQNINIDKSNIKIVEPVGYLNMIWLIDNCNLVLTDSGGLQKEAYFFKKNCITLRDETEWTELVDIGANQLAGTNKNDILDAYTRFMNVSDADFELKLYGDGNASKSIVSELAR